jgi:hypothetical protein
MVVVGWYGMVWYGMGMGGGGERGDWAGGLCPEALVCHSVVVDKNELLQWMWHRT